MSLSPRSSRAAASLVLALVVPVTGCTAAPESVAGSPAAAATKATPATPASSAAPSGAAYPLGVTEYAPGARTALPTLSGRTLSGTPLSTAGLTGQVVVLTVWASWCEPCQSELPGLGALARHPGPTAVRFVGLDEHDTASAATSAVRRAGSDYPHLVDDGGLLARLAPWLPDAVPGCVVVDAQGRVAARVVGQVTADQLRGVLGRVGV